MLDEVRQQMTPALQELRKVAAGMADPESDFRRSVGKLRELIEQLPLVTYIDEPAVAPSIYISPQIEGLLGYSADEWLGDPGLFVKLLHPDDRERVLAEHDRVFAAGDSDTDVTFLQDATAMKLAINRNKSEIMCNAYANYGKKWLINPMFIKPKGKYDPGYPCSSTGCTDKDGVKIPCLDEAGATIPDQDDTVF